MTFKFPEAPFEKQLSTAVRTDSIWYKLNFEKKHGAALYPRLQHTVAQIRHDMITDVWVYQYPDGRSAISFGWPSEYYVEDFIKTARFVVAENRRPFVIHFGDEKELTPSTCRELLFWLWSIGYREQPS